MINKFAERIKEQLIVKGKNQAELSRAIKVSGATVSEWINGKKQPTADNIILVADYFDVSADYLLGRTE